MRDGVMQDGRAADTPVARHRPGHAAAGGRRARTHASPGRRAARDTRAAPARDSGNAGRPRGPGHRDDDHRGGVPVSSRPENGARQGVASPSGRRVQPARSSPNVHARAGQRLPWAPWISRSNDARKSVDGACRAWGPRGLALMVSRCRRSRAGHGERAAHDVLVRHPSPVSGMGARASRARRALRRQASHAGRPPRAPRPTPAVTTLHEIH